MFSLDVRRLDAHHRSLPFFGIPPVVRVQPSRPVLTTPDHLLVPSPTSLWSLVPAASLRPVTLPPIGRGEQPLRPGSRNRHTEPWLLVCAIKRLQRPRISAFRAGAAITHVLRSIWHVQPVDLLVTERGLLYADFRVVVPAARARPGRRRVGAARVVRATTGAVNVRADAAPLRLRRRGSPTRLP